MPKIAIYTRFSPRPNAADCDSCDKQYDRCWNFYATAMQKGVYGRGDRPPAVRYDEKSTSGDSLESRPILQEAIDSLYTGDILLVASNDRLARDLLAYLTIQQAVKDRGATIEFADGTPPAITPEGELVQGILAVISAYQRKLTKKKTSEGVRKALKKRKDEGKHQGKAPFGHEWKDGRLVCCLREQKILNEIRYGLISGASAASIAREINTEYGYLRKKPATAAAIRKLIRKHGYNRD